MHQFISKQNYKSQCKGINSYSDHDFLALIVWFPLVLFSHQKITLQPFGSLQHKFKSITFLILPHDRCDCWHWWPVNPWTWCLWISIDLKLKIELINWNYLLTQTYLPLTSQVTVDKLLINFLSSCYCWCLRDLKYKRILINHDDN